MRLAWVPLPEPLAPMMTNLFITLLWSGIDFLALQCLKAYTSLVPSEHNSLTGFSKALLPKQLLSRIIPRNTSAAITRDKRRRVYRSRLTRPYGRQTVYVVCAVVSDGSA